MVHVHVSYEMKYHQMRVISSGLQEGTSLRAGSFVQKLGKIMKKRGGGRRRENFFFCLPPPPPLPPLFSPVLPNFCTNEPARRLGGYMYTTDAFTGLTCDVFEGYGFQSNLVIKISEPLGSPYFALRFMTGSF